MAMTQETITKELKRIVREEKRPYDFRVATKQYPDGLVTFVVWEDEINSFEDEQRANVLIYLERLRSKVESLGLRCGLEGASGQPPTRPGR